MAQEQVDGDGPSYATASEIMSEADATVRVKITDDLGTQLDDGGSPGIGGFESGLPVRVLEGAVIDSYGSDTPVPITILYLDTAAVGREDEVPTLEVGHEIILAYEVLSAEEMPGIHSVENAYIPIGAHYGVLDVTSSGQVSPRGELMAGLDEAPEVKRDVDDGPVFWPLADVEALAVASNGDNR